MYCNMPGLAAKRGNTVRYILIGMGSEADLHSPIFTGQVRGEPRQRFARWAVLRGSRAQHTLL